MTIQQVTLDRIQEIRRLGAMGQTMAAISRKMGLSRQRVKQLVDRHIPDWNEHYGRAVDRKAHQDARYAKWGVREDTELYYAKRKKFFAKKHAKKSWAWDIEFGDLYWPTHCPILGIELDYFAEGQQDNSVSFDRIDNSLGYTKGNVQVLSWRANRLKNDGTAAELRRIADFLDRM